MVQTYYLSECGTHESVDKKGELCIILVWGQNNPIFRIIWTNFRKRKFRASLSLISIKNWQELFLTIKRECTYICMYECMCIENSWHPASKEHFSLLLFRIFIRSQWRKNKRTRIWVLGIWNKGSCKRCVRSSDEKSLWINTKIYHTSDLSQFVKTLARAGQAWPAAS